MNNFYAVPQSDLTTPQGYLNERLKRLNFKELKKFYHRSCNVTAIAGLITLGVIFFSIALTTLLARPVISKSELFLFIGLDLLYVLTAITLIRRNQIGRFLGILTCFLALLNIPIGTLVGAAGLFAFFGAPELFGSDRITHKEVKAEYKYRKKTN